MMTQRPARRAVCDFRLEAWTVYLSIMTQHHPDRVSELIGYQHLILDAHQQFKTESVLNYDSAFRAGRTFMRRLWDATLAVPELHYRITLSESCRADLAWWRYLLDTWNGRSFFLQPGWSPAPHMHLFTDASGTLGYGAFLDGPSWFSGTWLPDQQACCITYKELYPIALACSTWGHEWSSLRVEFHSDNQAVVSSLHEGSCRCSNVMSLLRRLFLVCALQNFNVSASHVKGVSNGIADSLSRQDFGRFRTLAPQAAAIPDTVRPLPNIPGQPSLVLCTSTHSNR